MMKDLEKLFRSELNSIYDGERQLVEALNKLEQKAGSQELKTALKEHQLETREHVSRLKQVFGDLSETPKRKPCHGLTGIIDEALMAAEDFKGHPVLDAALVNAGQKAEHFEIATYGTLCSWADQLKYDSAAQFLKQTLSEEKNAEQKLRGLVDSTVESDGRPEFERDLKILFLRQMRELYDAENLLAAALPEVEFYAVSRILKIAVHHHCSQTQNHVFRLREAFREMRETADRTPCDAIEGIIDDAQVDVMEFLGNSALDAALIACAQKAEHYEITAYRTLLKWAPALEEEDLTGYFRHNLADEIATDKTLTLAAEWLRNPKAARGESAKRSSEEAEFLKLATHAG